MGKKISLSVAFASIVLAILILVAIHNDRNGPRKFDQNLWMQAQQDFASDVRVTMSADLVAILLKSHHSRNEVLQLLGPPENDLESGAWRYRLGHKYLSLVRLNSYYLWIQFDKTGNCVAARAVGE